MKRIFKFSLIAALVILVPLGAALITGWWLKNSTPDWYPAKVLTPAEMDQAAQSMQTKFLFFQAWAADINQEERTLASGRPPVPTDPTTAPARVQTISLTEAELNAFFSRWDDEKHLNDKYSQYVTDPILVLQDDRLILAGNVPEAGTLVSVHIDPKLDEQGKLRLEIAKVMGGKLQVPRAFYDRYRSKFAASLSRRIDRERKNVKLNSDGSANTELIAASMNELLLHAINGEPAEPILFVPHDALHPKIGLPVRLTDVKVKDKTITLTVVPLNSVERKELVRRVRQQSDAGVKPNPGGIKPNAALSAAQ